MNQLAVFGLSIICGGASALIFFFIDRLFPENKVFSAVRCAVLFAVITALYCIFSVIFDFGDFRFYIFAGICFGFMINFKSLSVTLAFFRKMFYNKDKRISAPPL